MKVYTHNYDPRSDSGPNTFTSKLFKRLSNDGINICSKFEDADIEFCLIQEHAPKRNIPRILRLDGIYFNNKQQFNILNKPILATYKNADTVVFQSKFNKALTEKWFGVHNNSVIIPNGADINLIDQIPVFDFKNSPISEESEIWSCASNWRGHKRLKDNVLYFLKYAPDDAKLIIAGHGAHRVLDFKDKDVISQFGERVFYIGHLNWELLISLYKRSTTFLHLAFLDHCPNVVVEAQAAGCEIICASSGGTHELVKRGKIIKDIEWDFLPIDLYSPPELNFENFINVNEVMTDYYLEDAAVLYKQSMQDLVK